MSLPDDAPLREHLREYGRELRAEAKEAARRQAVRARTAAVRRWRYGWAETRQHRPAGYAAFAIGLGTLAFVHDFRIAAALATWPMLTLGPVVAYLAAYSWKVWRSTPADRPTFPQQRVGRKARVHARRWGRGTALYGLWLGTLATFGVNARDWTETLALAVELLAGCVATYAALYHYWERRWNWRQWHHDRAAGRDITEETLAEPAAEFAADAVDDAEPAPADPDDQSSVIAAVLVKHDIDATVTGHVRGPMVTRYELELGAQGSVDDIQNRARDLAYALKTPDVRIMSPIPGQSLVGVEVPNAVREFVTLDEALSVINPDAHPLLVCLGKSVEGGYVVSNVADWPHIAIAGTTGGGKSSTLNTILCTIIQRTTPEQVQLLLIDPKRVELISYRKVPHLVRPIVVDPDDAGPALEWVKEEMLRRYNLFADIEVEKIDEYNAEMDRTGGTRLSYLLVVVDELADLMMVAEDDRRRRRGQDDDDMPNVERLIIRITQLARAAGIHLILATQRPDVKVVTGRIKANVPSRLAHTTASLTDSRVILDQPGAEKLTGRGDGLFLPVNSPTPVRLQAAFVAKAAVKAIVAAAIERFGEFVTPQRPSAPRVATQLAATPDVILAVIAAVPGGDAKAICAHSVWATQRLSPPSQSQFSRIVGPLAEAGVLSRVKAGQSWVDYRVTESGQSRAEVACRRLGLRPSWADVEVAA